MIDLHTHSNYSDGSDSVITLLENAEKNKVEVLSITDHVTCKAYEELKHINIEQYYTGKIVKGCELYTSIDGQTIELLAYNIDTELFNKVLPSIYYDEAQDNKLLTQEILEKCKSIGIHMDYENIKIRYEDQFGCDIVFEEIVKYPQNKELFDNEKAWSNKDVFYRECISNSKSKFFIDKRSFYPTIDKVIDLVKSAGGLVFIPHIFAYGSNSEKFLDFLIQNYNIDGIECYYSTFTEEQTKYLLDLCKKNNKYVSGGTDYHGSNRPGIELGNANIKHELVKKWVN